MVNETKFLSRTEALQIMSQKMLQGYALTGSMCPSEECNRTIPLIRSRDGVLSCARCQRSFSAQAPQQNSDSAHNTGHVAENNVSSGIVSDTPVQLPESNNVVNGQFADADECAEICTTDAQLENNDEDFTIQNTTDEGVYRGHVSNVISRRMGPKLLQGWRMLADVCDSDYCGAPLLEKNGTRMCVVCPGYVPPDRRTSSYSTDQVRLTGNDYMEPPKRSALSQTAANTSKNDSTIHTSDGDNVKANDWEGALAQVQQDIDTDAQLGPTARTLSSMNQCKLPQNTSSSTDNVSLKMHKKDTLSKTQKECTSENDKLNDPIVSKTALSTTRVLPAPTNWWNMTEEELHSHYNSTTPQDNMKQLNQAEHIVSPQIPETVQNPNNSTGDRHGSHMSSSPIVSDSDRFSLEHVRIELQQSINVLTLKLSQLRQSVPDIHHGSTHLELREHAASMANVAGAIANMAKSLAQL